MRAGMLRNVREQSLCCAEGFDLIALFDPLSLCTGATKCEGCDGDKNCSRSRALLCPSPHPLKNVDLSFIHHGRQLPGARTREACPVSRSAEVPPVKLAVCEKSDPGLVHLKPNDGVRSLLPQDEVPTLHGHSVDLNFGWQLRSTHRACQSRHRPTDTLLYRKAVPRVAQLHPIPDNCAPITLVDLTSGLSCLH